MSENNDNKIIKEKEGSCLKAITLTTHDKMPNGGTLTTRIHCFQSNKPILPVVTKESKESND